MRAALFGLLVGLINGGLCHAALYWALDKKDKVFYTVWGSGFLYRLGFFGGAFWYLMKEPVLPMVPAMLGLVAGQFAVGVIPLKRGKQKG